MKILHLSRDNKFLPFALDSFELAFPNSNYVWLLDGVEKNYKNQNNISKKQCFLFSKVKELNNYDIVILHSLELYWFFLVLFSKNVRFLWVGWGYDYYDLIKSESPIILEKRLNILKKKQYKSFKNLIYNFIKELFKKSVIKKIDSFAPVLPIEYKLLQNSCNLRMFPKYVNWNYGSIERCYIKGYEKYKVRGQSVLVGNSATETNNHIEIIDILNDINVNTKCIFPLNYGDCEYRDLILEEGTRKLKNNFHPIVDFLEYDHYVKILSECKSVIMNHVRQQALGNIFVILYFGSRLFLRKENPIYITLIDYGFFINTIDDLKDNSSLLDQELTEVEIENNRTLLIKHWGEDIMLSKTKKLLNCDFI